MNRIRSVTTRVLALAVALLLAGANGAPAATAPPQATTKPPKDPFGDLAGRQRKLAQEAEGTDDPLRAVAHWEYVAAANPNDAAAKAKIAALRRAAGARAARYFKEGFAQYEEDNIGPAFKALLKGLSYDPTNQEAVRLVKLELNAKSLLDYTVEPGDTLASIAKKHTQEGYNDPKHSLVIARFNNLDDGATLRPGRTLKVPVLVGVFPKAGGSAVAGAVRQRARAPEPVEETSELDDDKSDDQAAQAKALLKENKFDEAAKLAAAVLEDDPLNKEAKDVSNAANMGLGRRFLEAKKFEAALSHFSRVDADYPQQPESLIAARSQIKDDAELSYQEGVKHFLNDDLEGAIKAFQTTLKINPRHAQARKDMEVAQNTWDALQEIE